jgi:hypothetical protein
MLEIHQCAARHTLAAERRDDMHEQAEPLCKTTTSAAVSAPIGTAVAPSVSEVCTGCRPVDRPSDKKISRTSQTFRE